MNPRDKMPLGFVLPLLALALLLAGAVWYGWESQGKLQRLEREHQRLQSEWQRLGRAEWPSDAATASQLGKQVEDARARLAGVLDPLLDAPEAQHIRAQAIPGKSTDAYFDIAATLARLRDFALEHAVKIPTGFSFGLSEYASRGPEVKDIPDVHRQRQVIALLVAQLFAAKPRELLAVSRGSNDAKTGPQRGRHMEADTFSLDPRMSLDGVLGIHATDVELVFTGSTRSLRDFLSAIVTSPLPLFVRSVEAGDPPRVGSRSLPPSFGAPVELASTLRTVVSPTPRKFVVAVEWLDRSRRKGEP